VIIVGATPSTGRRRRGGGAFDGQWVAWASGVWGVGASCVMRRGM